MVFINRWLYQNFGINQLAVVSENGVLTVNYAGWGGNSSAFDMQYITANSQLLQLK